MASKRAVFPFFLKVFGLQPNHLGSYNLSMPLHAVNGSGVRIYRRTPTITAIILVENNRIVYERRAVRAEKLFLKGD